MQAEPLTYLSALKWRCKNTKNNSYHNTTKYIFSAFLYYVLFCVWLLIDYWLIENVFSRRFCFINTSFFGKNERIFSLFAPLKQTNYRKFVYCIYIQRFKYFRTKLDASDIGAIGWLWIWNCGSATWWMGSRWCAVSRCRNSWCGGRPGSRCGRRQRGCRIGRGTLLTGCRL